MYNTIFVHVYCQLCYERLEFLNSIKFDICRELELL